MQVSYGHNGGTDHDDTIDTGMDNSPRFVAPTHGGVDILKLLTELESLVEKTRHGPMGMLLGFPEDQFHMTVMKIRANLPEEMKRASKLVREHERIVEESRQYAEQMKDEARRLALADTERARAELAQVREQTLAEAERLRTVSDDEIARVQESAKHEAQRILEEARAQSEQVIAAARAQAAQLVDDNEILQHAQVRALDLQQRAEEEALDLQQRAEEEAQAVRRGADDYARDVLGNLESILGRAAAQVQRGRELLEQPRS
jgi:hypothetical protein